MQKQLVPPLQYQRIMGHHWLRFTGGTSEMMIAQWNPGSRTWTHSNRHDTSAPPLELSSWEWVSYVPYPEA